MKYHIIIFCPNFRVITDNEVSWTLTGLGETFINQLSSGTLPIPLEHGDLIGFGSSDPVSTWDWHTPGSMHETFVYKIQKPIVKQVRFIC